MGTIYTQPRTPNPNPEGKEKRGTRQSAKIKGNQGYLRRNIVENKNMLLFFKKKRWHYQRQGIQRYINALHLLIIELEQIGQFQTRQVIQTRG
jgi:hypothetical protein